MIKDEKASIFLFICEYYVLLFVSSPYLADQPQGTYHRATLRLHPQAIPWVRRWNLAWFFFPLILSIFFFIHYLITIYLFVFNYFYIYFVLVFRVFFVILHSGMFSNMEKASVEQPSNNLMTNSTALESRTLATVPESGYFLCFHMYVLSFNICRLPEKSIADVNLFSSSWICF
jgi:hypothetical protein